MEELAAKGSLALTPENDIKTLLKHEILSLTEKQVEYVLMKLREKAG